MRLELCVLSANHPLEACDSVGDVLGHLRERSLAHQNFALRESYHRRCGPQPVVVGNHFWSTLMPYANIAVRAAKIYSYRNRHGFSVRVITLVSNTIATRKVDRGAKEIVQRLSSMLRPRPLQNGVRKRTSEASSGGMKIYSLLLTCVVLEK